MKFWLEEIASCPNHQLVALTATKDVQDAVLQDSLYNKIVTTEACMSPKEDVVWLPDSGHDSSIPVQRLVKAFIGLYTNIVPVIRKKR